METKIATFIGMCTGMLANIIWGNLALAVFTAFCTGMAAYGGQQLMKWIHNKIKLNGKRRT